MPLAKLFGKLGRKLRRATAFARCEPDFVVAGTMKGGSTTLFAYLAKHPQVRTSNIKEVHYYDRNVKKGQYWYRAHFPLKFCVPRGVKVGEVTPCYLFHPHTAKDLHQFNPQTRIILLLRNPIERAISHYFHNKRKNKERLDMLSAFQQEETRIAAGYKVLLHNPRMMMPWEVINHSYKARGSYYRQLRRLRQYFPMKQILLLSTESLAADPHGTMRKVYEFIGVDPALGTTEVLRENVGANRQPVSEDVRSYLHQAFLPSHQAFERHYGSVYPFP